MININPTEQFSDLVNLIQTLRGPNGCPWDKEQTHESLKSNLIEESYETLNAIDNNDQQNLSEELGDVLFSLVNLARFLDIDPDASLRSTILKFENRFKKVEKVLSEKGKTVQESDLDEMDQIWNDIKKNK